MRGVGVTLQLAVEHDPGIARARTGVVSFRLDLPVPESRAACRP